MQWWKVKGPDWADWEWVYCDHETARKISLIPQTRRNGDIWYNWGR